MQTYYTMKKLLYALAVALLWSQGALYAQNLATWVLTTDGLPTFEASNIFAEALVRGNGVAEPTYLPTGAMAYAWEESSDINPVDYLEFCLSSGVGNDLDITGLRFTEQRNATGIRAYRLKYSTDGFQTYTLLADNTVPDDELARTTYLSSLNIRVCEGEQICFRWYGYQAEDFTGEWSLSDVEIEGSALTPCTPPSGQASGLVVTSSTASQMGLNWLNGSSGHTIILTSAGSPLSKNPFNGLSYTANADFQLGSTVGNASVVYTGTGQNTIVTNLDPGETYFFAAFAYDPVSMCYQRFQPSMAAATTLCQVAGTPAPLSYTALSSGTTINWASSACYDEILLVASESPIASFPTSIDGSGYTVSNTFGSGSTANGDFLPTEYPVYQGTGNSVDLTGLLAGQTYYLRAYTRWGSTWTAGQEVVIVPKQGCAELNGDVVFINEFHYSNAGGDMDEGVEIAGPAGVDLSNYALTFYAATGGIMTSVGQSGQVNLSGIIDNEDQGFGAVWFPVADLPYSGGIALWNTQNNQLVEFISYRANGFTGTEGIADGVTTDRLPPNVYEQFGTAPNYSLQRVGISGDGCPSSLAWQGPLPASRGSINAGQQAIFPIELTTFDGVLKGDAVLLSWSTATEVNNDYMEVEHSVDGRQFTAIGQRKGLGTSQVGQDYELWHQQPRVGINYYRLRQVDFDGTVNYHPIIAVDYRVEQVDMTVSPTIARQEVNVQMLGDTELGGELSVWDALGQRHHLRAIEGSNIHSIAVSQLPSGQYWLVWQQPDGTRTTKTFLKK